MKQPPTVPAAPLVSPIAALCLCLADQERRGPEMIDLVSEHVGRQVPKASIYSTLRRMKRDRLIVERKDSVCNDGRLKFVQASAYGKSVRKGTIAFLKNIISCEPDD